MTQKSGNQILENPGFKVVPKDLDVKFRNSKGKCLEIQAKSKNRNFDLQSLGKNKPTKNGRSLVLWVMEIIGDSSVRLPSQKTKTLCAVVTANTWETLRNCLVLASVRAQRDLYL